MRAFRRRSSAKCSNRSSRPSRPRRHRLGLSQVYGFIKQSGGHVRLYSEVGVGTTVKLYLPRALQQADDPVAVFNKTAQTAPRGLTVLLVEDEPGVRAFAVEALTELGFDVIAAEDGETALGLLAITRKSRFSSPTS